MSAFEGSTSILSLIATVITGIIVAVLYVTTRFGKGEIKGAVTQSALKNILDDVSDFRKNYGESYKELKQEVRVLQDKVNEVNTTLRVEAHISTETKTLINDLQKRIFELERKIFELDRRSSRDRDRSPVSNGH